MSKFKLARKIKNEIKRLNDDIDLKIIKGLPYKAEAKRHKFLISQFYTFNNYVTKAGFFKKTLYVIASFIL